AIANGFCTFPDGKTVESSPDFRFIAAMNTYGNGATTEYVGRNRLDAATLDRFVFLELEHDEQLERALLGLPYGTIEPKMDKEPPTVEQWHDKLVKYRKAVSSLSLKHVISPR